MSPEERAALLATAFPQGAPRLGFGSGDLYGGARFTESRRVIEAAFDAGFRYFDTARLYGDGSAESVLGAALKGRRDQVVLASKAGILPWRMRLGTRLTGRAARLLRRAAPLVPEPAPPAALFDAFRPAQLRRSLEASLKALAIDHLDILLLHDCGLEAARREEVAGFLDRMRSEGKVRFTGSATGPETSAALLAEPPGYLDVVQVAGDAAVLPAASQQASGALFMTHSPLKRRLPELLNRAAAEPVFAARLAALTGGPAQDPAALAPLLLALALDDNPAGAVIFSTLKPARAAAVRQAVAAVDPAVLPALRQVLGSLPAAAEA